MQHANLILHCGAHAVDRAVLENVPTPRATATWQPVAHIDLLTTVEDQLNGFGLQVVEEAHGLTHDGKRYFGLLQVANGRDTQEYALVLGLRNSHDKVLPAGLVAGSQVFVCDNLAFMGEIKVFRKHTRFCLRDLPGMISDALGGLRNLWRRQDDRILTFKAHELPDHDAHDLIIHALDAGVICGEKVPALLEQWRNPKHEEFQPRTLWSWFNATTEILKGNLPLLPRRTTALYQVCDEYVSLANGNLPLIPRVPLVP